MVREVLEVKNEILKKYIDSYWYMGFLGEEQPPMKLPPMGFPTMHIQFGERLNFYNYKNFTSESVLIGQFTKHVMLYPIRGIRFLGINFKPYGLYNLFGFSPSAILNSAIEGASVFGESTISRMTSLLTDKEMVVDAIPEIEEILLEFKSEKVVAQTCFDQLVDQMVSEKGLVKIDDLLNQKYSIRSFQRYFKEVIGVSPKMFAKVLRHKFIMELLYANPDLKWNDAILNGFYYDYSHLKKDFFAFTEQKPMEYLTVKNEFASIILS